MFTLTKVVLEERIQNVESRVLLDGAAVCVETSNESGARCFDLV